MSSRFRKFILVVPHYDTPSSNTLFGLTRRFVSSPLNDAFHQTRLWRPAEAVLNEARLILIHAVDEPRCAFDDLPIAFLHESDLVCAQDSIEKAAIMGGDEEKARTNRQRDMVTLLIEAIRPDYRAVGGQECGAAGGDCSTRQSISLILPPTLSWSTRE